MRFGNESPVILDGSRGEGGGQVLRMGLALCALAGRPLEMVRIRAGRRTPGLASQHLAGVQAAVTVTGGTVEGAHLGSQELRFVPGPIRGGDYTFDVAEVRGSAGSVCLLFQVLLPILAFAPEPSRLTLKGGTHVQWAPPIHYLRDVLMPTLHGMGLNAEIETDTWGWYPQGGGVARAEVQPVGVLNGVDLTEQGDTDRVDLLSVVSNLEVSIAQRQQDRARKRLEDAGISLRIETGKMPSPGKGTFVFLLAHQADITAGFSALGELGKPAEQVADGAVEAFFDHRRTQCPIDPHLADQIVLFLTLAQGRSEFLTSEITRHLSTAAALAGEITGADAQVEGDIGGPGYVSVEGIGLENSITGEGL